MKNTGKTVRSGSQLAAAAVLCLSLAPTLAKADTVSTITAGGYGRALFSFDRAMTPVAVVKDGVLTIAFPRKPGVSIGKVAKGLAAYVSSARTDPDGKTFRFALVQPVRLHSSVSQNRYALDLIPESFAGTPPDLPPPPAPEPQAVDVAKLAPLKVRAGAYSHFTRLVFDWPKKVNYAVFPGAGRITIRFEAEAKPDFRALENVAPPWVKQAGWRIDRGGTVIDFDTESQSGYHDFRDGNHVVLDILAPKTDANAYDPPGLKRADAAASIKPLKARPDTSKDAGTDTAQRAAILKTAEKLNGSAQAALPTPDPRPKPAAASAADPTQVAVAKGAATITLPGAATHPVAAFVRGLNGFIVVERSNAPDADKLASGLGSFADKVVASTSGTFAVLRIALKAPEQMRAGADGDALRIEIAPKLTAPEATPIAIGRDSSTPDVAALRADLPGAAGPLRITDPAAGDSLIVVPATLGHVLAEGRRYVDFAALPSAAGLVLTPFADSLDVETGSDSVRISMPDGLTLTAANLPAASAPSALVDDSTGPTFIDFAGWSHGGKGSFLEQERRLREAAARLDPSQANPARKSEARFYIANEFGAEALGLVNLIQQSDPTQQDDPQLQVIRAAADVMMARYGDAEKALSGTGFENDPHAALWRGLAQAGQDEWREARESLIKAMGVLDHYPPAWQARVRIAYARAATRTGAVSAAEKALQSVPKELPKALALSRELARANLDAAEKRYPDAHALFAALKVSGDPEIEAHAIYDDAISGLAAGTVSQTKAAATLEKLRYRWRGDQLELDTLRKLGQIYFAQKRWRDGFGILKTAVESFPHDEFARKAQDDMRAAFSELFLKGGADKMAPIKALGLFYDFIDLTPLGADGDEMIRRMADRLVNVDLLGPAEKLLKYQADNRLDGIARSQVAARLAMIYLMDHKAKEALAAIRTTRVAGMPDKLAHERLLLEARALAALKQWDQALDLVAVDDADDTKRLRADIYWESGNWAVAAQKTEELLGDKWQSPDALSDEQRHQVMRAAIAYSLAGDDGGLARLRQHFAAKMKQSPDATAFNVVTQSIDTQGVAFRDIAGKIASIDTLESFMKDFRKRYGDNAAVN